MRRRSRVGPCGLLAQGGRRGCPCGVTQLGGVSCHTMCRGIRNCSSKIFVSVCPLSNTKSSTRRMVQQIGGGGDSLFQIAL